ncbi:MAG: hypothetical protein ABIN91_19160 [Mucilaginibacter sp.]|uniref:hypothetical protein n=1 Tax=Mucilaginibacter sp. TaxID=1882438 RepID=UPI0032676E25
MVNPNDDYFILCEDDHQFTECYKKELLFECINQANDLNADILSGGVSGVSHFVQVRPDIFWMGNFTGLQFTIIYRRFFKIITNAVFADTDIADVKISKLSERKFLIHPFISTQKEFGYSDVTPLNNNQGRVDKFFDWASHTIKYVNDVSIFYKHQKKEIFTVHDAINYENIYIPTYIVNLPGRTDHLAYITKQFEGKAEFAVKVIDAIEHKKSNLGRWLTIRKIVEQAIKNEDNMIIICDDDHEFTNHYSKHDFIENIIEANMLGAGILIGGTDRFGNVTLVTENKFWIDSYFNAPFMVIYESLFTSILDAPYDEKTTANGVFSKITSNKLLVFPFISVRRVLEESNKANTADHIDKLFQSTSASIEMMIKVTNMYPYDHS